MTSYEQEIKIPERRIARDRLWQSRARLVTMLGLLLLVVVTIYSALTR